MGTAWIICDLSLWRDASRHHAIGPAVGSTRPTTSDSKHPRRSMDMSALRDCGRVIHGYLIGSSPKQPASSVSSKAFNNPKNRGPPGSN